jgi:chromosome segregation ATPase
MSREEALVGSDVEREARSRLRPLKRQAEAAELHERLERQILQARWELARDQSRARRIELAGAEVSVAEARTVRAEIEHAVRFTTSVPNGKRMPIRLPMVAPTQ